MILAFMSLLLLLTSCLAQDPAAAAPASGTPVAKGPVAPAAEPGPPRYAFSTLGGHLLDECTAVVEGKAAAVMRGGASVVVASVDVRDVLYGEPDLKRVAVLAAPGELHAGQTYLLFLKPYGTGGRYTALRRVAEGDRDYAGKRRVLGRFAEVHAIADPAARALAIRDVLLEHLADEELFVRWNALAELKSFVPGHRHLFGRAERAAVVEMLQKESSPTFRRELMQLLKLLGVDLEGSLPENR